MREEYIAQLDPFTDLLPDRLTYRFRLERLKKHAAFLAIRRPLMETGSYNKELENDINDIISNLEDAGEFIEPIHLQVVCQRWWLQRSSAKENFDERISRENLADVDKALEEFYTNALQYAAKETGTPEKDLREWCESQLITSSETRGIVHQSENSTAGMSNRVVEILNSRYLIRPEIRSSGVWYELTHDRLVKPIKYSNLKWKEQERKRKSKRHKIIIIPSVAAVTIAVLILLYPSLVPPPEPEDILLGQNPSYISVNPMTNMVYASSFDNNTISVIDGETQKVKDIITVNKKPSFISVNPMTNMIYVSNFGNDSISVIDGKSHEVLKDIKIMDAYDISVDPNTNRIYVSGYNYTSYSGSILIIDGITNDVVEDITLDYAPTAVSVNPNTNRIYAAVYDSISVIDGNTNSIVIDMSIDENLIDLSVNPETNMIYISDLDSNIIHIVNGEDNRKEEVVMAGPEPHGIKVKQDPSNMAINPNTSMIYIANTDSDGISVINGTARKETDAIREVTEPYDIAVNPNTNLIYVASLGSHSNLSATSLAGYITVINGTNSTIIEDIELYGDPSSWTLHVNPITNMIYISESYADYINVINGTSNEIDDIIYLDNVPSYIAVNTNTNRIYAASFNSSVSYSGRHYIDVIDGGTGEKIYNIPFDLSISGMAINPNTNMLYVATYDDTNAQAYIYFINGTTNTLANLITTAQEPSDISVNPNTNRVYVAGFGSNSYELPTTYGYIDVIDGKMNKIIDEIKLKHVESSDHIAVNTYTNTIYILSESSDSLSFINGTTNELLKGNQRFAKS
jgi:YVTN family beta-propeller protein